MGALVKLLGVKVRFKVACPRELARVEVLRQRAGGIHCTAMNKLPHIPKRTAAKTLHNLGHTLCAPLALQLLKLAVRHKSAPERAIAHACGVVAAANNVLTNT